MKFFHFGVALAALVVASGATGCGGGDTSGTGGSGGSTSSGPVCGNGTVEDGEQCDDGDKNADTAACKTDCTPAACGDSLVGPGEECDVGTMNSDTGACTSMCKNAACGDAVVQQGVESCDNGSNNADTAECTTECKQAACGDKLIQEGVEECDDGAANADNAGCTTECKTNVCGDGKVKNGKEECDDGAANADNAACTSMCKAAKCGDGLTQIGVEGCDDANMVDGDGCTNNCTLPSCGDGVKQMGEDCDLGAQNSNTGVCTTLCKNAACGDGFTQMGVEECDNAAQNNNSAACTATCKNAKCGDGFVQAGVEECDLAAQNSNTGGCTLMCKNAKCGDGFILSGVEACDDGNMTSADGCNNDCIVSGTPLLTVSYNGPVSNGVDSWAGVATDAMGNIYVTGTEQSAVQGQNLVVRKYSPQGVVIWNQIYNNPNANSNEEGLGIALDPMGNVFVIGYETLVGGTTNIYLAKHNGSTGAPLWQKSYDGGLNNNDFGWGVVANAAGDVFIAAQVVQVLAQGTDILVAKVAGINGTQVWTDFVNGVVVAGGNNNDAGLGITLDAQGAVIATGGIRGFQDYDVWVRKYTDNGVSNTVQWTRTYNNGVGVADDIGYAVTTDAMNNVIVGGVETVVNQGGNMWVRKYDKDGNTVWTRTYASATTFNDIVYGVDTDAAGNIVIGGFEAIANGTADMFVRKYNPAGTELWTQKYNGNADQDDVVNNVFIDAAGNVFVAGYQTVTNQGSDAWLRKYAP